MTSDGRREEVAARLRALDVADLGDEGGVIDDIKQSGWLFCRIVDAANDYRPGLHYFPSHFTAGAVPALLADLIDPTCEYVPIGDERFGCSGCGNTVRLDYDVPVRDDTPMPFRYCPSCGARVVRSGD